MPQMRAVFAILILVLFQTACSRPENAEAMAVAKRFADSLGKFEVSPMVDEMHSEMRQNCHEIAIRMVESQQDEATKSDLLKFFQVENFAALKAQSAAESAGYLFEASFSYISEGARKASLNANLVFIGQLSEGELIHVLYRSRADAEVEGIGFTLSVPSVVTLKPDGNKLKVISTTQFDSLKSKFQIAP